MCSSALALVPAAFKAAKNPDGATLKDVLSPGDYATWLRLKQKYLGDDDGIEKYRPMVAEDKLNTAIGKKKMKKLRTTWVDDVVRKAAKKHKVRIHELPARVRKIKVEKPRAILKAARNHRLGGRRVCGPEFGPDGKGRCEGLLDFNVAAVNAWATGDLDAMRAQADANRDNDLASEDCTTSALDAATESQPAERATKCCAVWISSSSRKS